MCDIVWTPHVHKSRSEVDALYRELEESIALDGPHEFPVLCCAARLLETRYAVARLVGFPAGDVILDYSDVVELLLSLPAARDDLSAGRTGVLELYPGPGADHVVFYPEGDDVRLFLVPWEETAVLDRDAPVPAALHAHRSTVCARGELLARWDGFGPAFAREVVRHDPRLAGHEPIRGWSRHRP